MKNNRVGTQTETNETVFWYNVNFDCEMGSLVTVLTPPSPRVHLGAFNGHHTRMKDHPKGPPGGVLFLYMRGVALLGGFLGVSRPTEHEILSVSSLILGFF